MLLDIQSFSLYDRNLNLSFVVRKRPHLGDLTSDASGPGAGVLAIEHDGEPSPPIAVSFCKVETFNRNFSSILSRALFDSLKSFA